MIEFTNISDSPTKGKGLACSVLMLDDSVHVYEIPIKSTGQLLFDAVVCKLQLLEADYFDLQYNDSESIPSWLDREKLILKQISSNNFTFKFVVKFYTPDPVLLEEEFSRYLFALQIKRDLRMGFLQCQEHTAILLASYIVQAEFGDYCEELITQNYISSIKFLPQYSPDVEFKIIEQHKEQIGQSPLQADFNLLDTARKVELYGIHMNQAKDREGITLNLAVAHMGVLVFQNFTKINSFSWAKIRKICFKRKKFVIKLHPDGCAYNKDAVEFYFMSRNSSKKFWKKCIEYHAFFRCQFVRKSSKAKVVSRGSSFRYSGKTQKELIEFVRENCHSSIPFERSTSMRTMLLVNSRLGTPKVDSGLSHSNQLLKNFQHHYNKPILDEHGHGIFQDPHCSLKSRTFSTKYGNKTLTTKLVNDDRLYSQTLPNYQKKQISNDSGSYQNSTINEYRSLIFQQKDMNSKSVNQPPLNMNMHNSNGSINSVKSYQGSQSLKNNELLRSQTEFDVFNDQSFHNYTQEKPESLFLASPSISVENSEEIYDNNLNRRGKLNREYPLIKTQHDNSSLNNSLRNSNFISSPINYNNSLSNYNSSQPNFANYSLLGSSIDRLNSDCNFISGKKEDLIKVSVQVTLPSGSASIVSSSLTTDDDEENDDLNNFKKKFSDDPVYFILKEFILTEKTFKKDLEVIVMHLKEYSDNTKAMPEFLANLIFGIFNPIYGQHCQLLEDMNLQVLHWERKEILLLENDQKNIAGVLMQYLKSLMSYYNKYLNRLEELLLQLNWTKKNHQNFENFISDFENEKICYLPLLSFFLKPLQRLYHYRILMEKLIKVYNPHHFDFKNCQECLIYLTNVTEEFSIQLKHLQHWLKLLDIQKDILNLEDFMQPNRLFIREGCLQKMSKSGNQQRFFLLFTDILIYAGCTNSSSLLFKVHGSFDLKDLKVIDVDSSTALASNSELIFALEVPNCYLILAASSKTEKLKWLKDLNSAIDRCKHETTFNDKTDLFKYNFNNLKSTNSSCELHKKSDVDFLSTDNQQHQRANCTVHVCWHRGTSISLDDIRISFMNQLSSFLMRKLKNSNGWQRLWVVFTNFCLFFYKASQEKSPLASLPLLGYSIETLTNQDVIDKEFVFKLQFKNHVYFFRSDNQYFYERWIEVIQNVINLSQSITIKSVEKTCINTLEMQNMQNLNSVVTIHND